jgi:hypothetical protein
MSSEGGFALIEKKRKSPPRDANHKMADGSAPENDLQQMSSAGGNARSNNTQQRLLADLGVGGPRCADLGVGAPGCADFDEAAYIVSHAPLEPDMRRRYSRR